MLGMNHGFYIQCSCLQMNNGGRTLLHTCRMSCNGQLMTTTDFCRRSRNNPDFFLLLLLYREDRRIPEPGCFLCNRDLCRIRTWMRWWQGRRAGQTLPTKLPRQLLMLVSYLLSGVRMLIALCWMNIRRMRLPKAILLNSKTTRTSWASNFFPPFPMGHALGSKMRFPSCIASGKTRAFHTGSQVANCLHHIQLHYLYSPILF